MSERPNADMNALERALTEVGLLLRDRVDSRDIAAEVRTRISSTPRRPRWSRSGTALRPVVRHRPAVARVGAAVLAAVVVMAATVVVSPGARHAVAGWLGLRGVDIEVVPSVPPTLRPVLGADLHLGTRVTFAQAEARFGAPLLVPHSPSLGAPDEVYLDSSTGVLQVFFVYRERPGIPRAATTGAAVVLSQFRAAVDRAALEKKLIPGASRLRAVRVGDASGYWIAGRPHVVLYRGPRGEVIEDSVRLAGNVLLWEHGDVTLRLESALSLRDALALASSVR